MTLKATPTMVSPAGVKGLRFEDEAATANALVPQLRAQGADVIVVAIHEGGYTDAEVLGQECSGINGDIVPILERLDPSVDVVVSGHTHQAYVCDYARINPARPFLLTSAGQYGALLTDFTRIRAGSIHRASGGVLVIRAGDLMADPIIWERLKRVLREGKLAPEEPVNPLGPYTTTLRPAGVPISVRVVMVGTPDVYDALREADNDFATMFRIKVEVEPVVERTPAGSVIYATPGGGVFVP